MEEGSRGVAVTSDWAAEFRRGPPNSGELRVYQDRGSFILFLSSRSCLFNRFAHSAGPNDFIVGLLGCLIVWFLGCSISGPQMREKSE